jgi:hypothetical protein
LLLLVVILLPASILVLYVFPFICRPWLARNASSVHLCIECFLLWFVFLSIYSVARILEHPRWTLRFNRLIVNQCVNFVAIILVFCSFLFSEIPFLRYLPLVCRQLLLSTTPSASTWCELGLRRASGLATNVAVRCFKIPRLQHRIVARLPLRNTSSAHL